MSGQRVGYIRVSSADQNEARQVEALGEVDTTFLDRASGKNTQGRPELNRMLDHHLRSGDLVVVKSPDRLARSTEDLLKIVRKIKNLGAEIQFVDNPALNTDTPQGEFVLTLLGAVAQLERATIKERQAEGIAIAKRKGVYQKKPKLSPEQIESAREKVEQAVPKAVIARQLGVSRQTLLNALNGEGVYAP